MYLEKARSYENRERPMYNEDYDRGMQLIVVYHHYRSSELYGAEFDARHGI
jgi:hypothetical protein